MWAIKTEIIVPVGIVELEISKILSKGRGISLPEYSDPCGLLCPQIGYFSYRPAIVGLSLSYIK